jgi:hypothetical protein
MSNILYALAYPMRSAVSLCASHRKMKLKAQKHSKNSSIIFMGKMAMHLPDLHSIGYCICKSIEKSKHSLWKALLIQSPR